MFVCLLFVKIAMYPLPGGGGVVGTTGEVVGGIGVGSAEDSNDNKTKLYLHLIH